MVSIKGKRICLNLRSNCVNTECPKVSAVMPVPSETKKTVRLAEGRIGVLMSDMKILFRLRGLQRKDVIPTSQKDGEFSWPVDKSEVHKVK